MSGRVDAYIAIGSNLDEPITRVRDALEALAGLPDTELVARSPLYGSTPMGPADQPDYVNAVARLATALSPHALLDQLQRLEAESGRERGGPRWGPRRLDLDIVVYGDRRIADERLDVPHPGAAERAFVLVPLAAIAPALEIPGIGRVAELAAALGEGTDLWRLGGEA